MEDFSVWLGGGTGPEPSECYVIGCSEYHLYLVTLAYCNCDEQPEEHGHPKSDTASRSYVRVCAYHCDKMIRFWEALEDWEWL